MTEVLVWLLITMGNNGATHTVATFKSEASCEATKNQVFYNRFAKCIQANILVTK